MNCPICGQTDQACGGHSTRYAPVSLSAIQPEEKPMPGKLQRIRRADGATFQIAPNLVSKYLADHPGSTLIQPEPRAEKVPGEPDPPETANTPRKTRGRTSR